MKDKLITLIAIVFSGFFYAQFFYPGIGDIFAAFNAIGVLGTLFAAGVWLIWQAIRGKRDKKQD